MQESVQSLKSYCNSLVSYSRRETIEVNIGDVPLGGSNPIRIQSMTTVDTMDTLGSVEQSIRMADAGCEYIRITAPSINEAKNLQNIKDELRRRGYDVPLVADIHFTPNAAELAARIVEKVRVNPGNYADKKKFEVIEYTDASYESELERIRERFTPLVDICKEYGTAMRIGTNHGSLSDRILSRYGDTPLGMVESALEFLRICDDMNYHNIVLSMKASNVQVMVEAYRLLVNRLNQEGLKPYPLHLGVTEAGEGEDGRIKSAAGIGTLLEDGLGDTVRVSLTEEPEFEAPVAKSLVDRYDSRVGHRTVPEITDYRIDSFVYNRRKTVEVENFGGSNVPRVVGDFSNRQSAGVKDLKNIGHFYLPELDKWTMNDQGADYIFTGKHPLNFMPPNGLKEIVDYSVWDDFDDDRKMNAYPLFSLKDFLNVQPRHKSLNFVNLGIEDIVNSVFDQVEDFANVVFIVSSTNNHALAEIRWVINELMIRDIDQPVLLQRNYSDIDIDQFQLYSSTDCGGLLVDGMGDGILLSYNQNDSNEDLKMSNRTAFGILQAARTRMSKTEYISCPSCGRTLFDLQETTAMIRKRTDHLKGVKIGIMGCIVNGPGEMADADYGYVGSGRGKITLYKGKEVIKRSVPSENAVDELIEIIREDGNWIEPEKVEVLE